MKPTFSTANYDSHQLLVLRGITQWVCNGITQGALEIAEVQTPGAITELT